MKYPETESVTLEFKRELPKNDQIIKTDESRVRSLDMRPLYDATRDDLDTTAIENFLKKRKQQTGKEVQKVSFDEALHAYHLVIKEQNKEFPTTAGILLFGKKPQHFFTEAFIVASQFVGKSLREVLATRDFTGSLIDQYQEAVAFVVSRLSHSYTIQGSLRVEKLEIPQEALREAILNAIVHRSYLIPSSIKIAIFDNRIEIFSPGSFIGPLNQKNLLDGYSYIRNLAIAKVFRELGYIEKMGTGFKIIFESYAARNLPAPQVIEGEDYVKVILPRPSPDYRPPEFSSEQQEPIDDSQKIIKLLSRYEKLTISNVLQELNIPRATAGRRLAHLVKQGTLRKIGEKRGAWYTKQKQHHATPEMG